MLKDYDGADGLKTGYIRASGFNIASSAERGGISLIGIVVGGRTASSRDAHIMNLLDRSFQAVRAVAKNREQPPHPGSHRFMWLVRRWKKEKTLPLFL